MPHNHIPVLDSLAKPIAIVALIVVAVTTLICALAPIFKEIP